MDISLPSEGVCLLSEVCSLHHRGPPGPGHVCHFFIKCQTLSAVQQKLHSWTASFSETASSEEVTVRGRLLLWSERKCSPLATPSTLSLQEEVLRISGNYLLSSAPQTSGTVCSSLFSAADGSEGLTQARRRYGVVFFFLTNSCNIIRHYTLAAASTSRSFWPLRPRVHPHALDLEEQDRIRVF